MASFTDAQFDLVNSDHLVLYGAAFVCDLKHRSYHHVDAVRKCLADISTIRYFEKCPQLRGTQHFQKRLRSANDNDRPTKQKKTETTRDQQQHRGRFKSTWPSRPKHDYWLL